MICPSMPPSRFAETAEATYGNQQQPHQGLAQYLRCSQPLGVNDNNVIRELARLFA